MTEVPVDEAITIAPDDGLLYVIASSGDTLLFDEEGAFKGVITEKERREKWVAVS